MTKNNVAIDGFMNDLRRGWKKAGISEQMAFRFAEEWLAKREAEQAAQAEKDREALEARLEFERRQAAFSDPKQLAFGF